MEGASVFLRWPSLACFCAGFALSFLLTSFVWSQDNNNVYSSASISLAPSSSSFLASSASAASPLAEQSQDRKGAGQQGNNPFVPCAESVSIGAALRDHFDQLRGWPSLPYPQQGNRKPLDLTEDNDDDGNSFLNTPNINKKNSPKVFGLGMPKTGTSSLARALAALGMDSRHTFHDPVRFMVLKETNDSIAPLSVDVVRRYDPFDAVSDNPIPWFFEELLLMYPEAKFILTTRNVTKWWASWKAHMQRHTDPTDVALRMRSLNFGWQQPNEYFCVKGFLRHNKLVQAIVPPEQLLVMDVTAGDGFSKLCPFLGVPEEKCPPDEEFPVANTKENPTGANGKHGGGRGRGSGRRPGHVVLPAKVPVHD
ncbi:Sulfotransferase family protein [Balamuthia mandrillaris]